MLRGLWKWYGIRRSNTGATQGVRRPHNGMTYTQWYGMADEVERR